jgi:hypothetical protein
MTQAKLLSFETIPDKLIANIESRDVALWVRGLPDTEDQVHRERILSFMNLPWKMILSEISDPWLIDKLEDPSTNDEQMVRKRGFIQVIDSDPSRINLPPRCLPIYLFNGRKTEKTKGFEDQLRQLTMLETLRRSDIKELIVISDTQKPIPNKLKDLVFSGFKTSIVFISNNPSLENNLDDWISECPTVASFIIQTPLQSIRDILDRYYITYPEDKIIIRVKNRKGDFARFDISLTDDPERPILENYSIILDKDLTPLMPEELPENDFINFFQNAEKSWKPYAAGLPWSRKSIWEDRFLNYIKLVDSNGSDENFVAYISSEPGAGGSTSSRTIAWEYAKKGYPVLVANPIPFIPDYISLSNFLLNANRKIQEANKTRIESSDTSEIVQDIDREKRYETPWIIIFDRMHWEYKELELRRFCNKLRESGRPVAIIVITGSEIEETFLNDTDIFKHIGILNHIIDQDEALSLGQHFNKFLRVFQKQRARSEWNNFYQQHTALDIGGQSSFWITLSFWLQHKYDMQESIQEWMYKSLKTNIQDMNVLRTIFYIAAMSSERLPTPAALIPESKSEYPMSHLLEEYRSKIPSIGLMQVKKDGDNYWTLIHDILGRFLINALFYDVNLRNELGFEKATETEHLRFMILKEISKNPILAEKSFETISERFATHIFKIDFDFGRGSFALFWRDVLDALDKMPVTIRQNNRVFLHHTAISRRRIAKLTEAFFNVSDDDKITLLERAIKDINYALNYIDYTLGSESNLNLYNSVARAYLDLATLKLKMGFDRKVVAELRNKANNATKTAYNENPTNSHVLETYVNNLLLNAKESPDSAIENCIEALGTIFSAIASKNENFRLPSLGKLADKTLEILFSEVAPDNIDQREPSNAVEILVKAWFYLSRSQNYTVGSSLAFVPIADREDAIQILEHPSGHGNMQILILSYRLICETYPQNFKKQLELIELLEKSAYRVSPQQKLEYAILLYQNFRHDEGRKLFVTLRQLWRESDHFVYVPKRLMWLWSADGKSPKKVTAFVVSDYGYRSMASVQDLGRQRIPFRSEEFSMPQKAGNNKIVCHVTFGNNGPFLRPVTTGP